MTSTNPSLDTLKDIRQMMERSSRFISLSGLSGVAAGCCALLGAWFAYDVINNSSISEFPRHTSVEYSSVLENNNLSLQQFMGNRLFLIAVFTFLSALILAFLFTWIRSRKTNTPIWGQSAQRLMINVSIPMLAGGIFLWKMIQSGIFGMIAPGCLIFYGLALINAGKYTLKEIRYLGLAQLLLGLTNLWFIGYGLYFWALGFGVLHIVYGIVMWWRYEKTAGV